MHPHAREAPEFHPTEEEFADFASYVSRLADLCGESGICKVVPPPSWSMASERPPAGLMVHGPIRQHIEGARGFYQVMNFDQPRLRLERFERLAAACAQRDGLERCSEAAAIEKFWREIEADRARPPLYGADLDMSLFPPPDVSPLWNLRRLPDLLRCGPASLPDGMRGITSPFVYFGQWRTVFPMHTEDMDLLSINYLHSGAPKQWYAVPSRLADLVEIIAAQYFSEQHAQARPAPPLTISGHALIR